MFFFSFLCLCTNATVALVEHQCLFFFFYFRNKTLKGLSHNNRLLKMIVVNPKQSFT